MKNVLKLSNYLFSWIMKKGGKRILGGSIAFGGILLLAGLVVLFVMIFWQAKSFYINNKGIYTLLTLPMKREQVYFAFLLSGMAMILLYFMVWLILIVTVYFPVMASHMKVAAEEIFYVTPTA